MLGSSRRLWADAPEVRDALREWTASLGSPEKRLYRGADLEHIAFPLGGIGAGQVYLTGRGRLGPWQILNNFNSHAYAPGGFFAIRAKAASGDPIARILEEDDPDGLPGVTAIEATGEYPYLRLQYLDGRLPVSVSLEAYTPFIPLNADDSGLPCALFRFTLRNTTAEPVDVSLLGSMPNLVGWDGYTPVDGTRHHDYIANRNTVERVGDAPVLRLGTVPGEPMSFAEPRAVHTADPRTAELLRYCENLDLRFRQPVDVPDSKSRALAWLCDELDRDARTLPKVFDAVEAGAALVLAPCDPFIDLASAKDSKEAGDIDFEDWEDGTFDRWTIEGDCFGPKPVTGTLENQQPVSGWRGKYYLSSFAKGDGRRGRAVSRSFAIERDYVHLQVGGGNHRGQTCVNLRINGQVVLSAVGDNTEVLRSVRWDVKAYRGQSAQIEIVDDHIGGWGHILVGDIVFSDHPHSPFMDPALVQRIREVLPFTWTGQSAISTPSAVVADGTFAAGLPPLTVGPHLRLDGFDLKPGARILLAAEDGSPLVVAGTLGQGTVVACVDALREACDPGARKALAARLLEAASGVPCTVPTGWTESSVTYGSMALALFPDPDVAEPLDVTAKAQWNDRADLWADFAGDGRLETDATDPSPAGQTWNGALCASLQLEPGQSRSVTFALAWHFPNRSRDDRYGWGPGPYRHDHRLGNRYNNRFKDANEVIAYLGRERARLDDETRRFHKTFHDSTLPWWLLDTVGANIANLRSPIFVWIEDGTFGGFEGADCCCPMNCTHVYNYAMTTAFLFPELERNVRETDLLVQMHPEKHFIPHRTVLPLSLPRLGDSIGGPHHHALDGELGAILKTLREWRHSGDLEWLKKVWPNAKLVMEHVLRDHDVDGTGVIRGEQPNTYDTHIFGSNTFVGSLYLAALLATEEMARVLGDDAFAATCRERYNSGREGYHRTCWNGEYYENIYDAPDATPDTYNNYNCYGPGCFSDQLLGQWWAYILEMPHLLPKDNVRQAFNAIYKYNWRPDLSNHAHHQRIFAEGSEKGLLTGTWPRGGRPEKPILYCDEVWTGLEYHVAASLIWEGEIEKGLQIAKGARDRYTGSQRNPWAEIECGHHYARALSSYSLLLALGGYAYHGGEQSLSLGPRDNAGLLRCFFAAGSGWGSLSHERRGGRADASLRIDYGSVTLRRIAFAMAGATPQAVVQLAGNTIPCTARVADDRCIVQLDEPLTLREGDELVIQTTV